MMTGRVLHFDFNSAMNCEINNYNYESNLNTVG